MNEHCHTTVTFVIYYYCFFFLNVSFTHLSLRIYWTSTPTARRIPAGFKTHTCVYTGQTTIHNNSNKTQTMFTLLDFYTLPGGSMS